ncbi:MAG: lipoprotein signal peptidase [Burkholderiales bacterium]|nr:lipoprotein signal peptidase [Burkholderiales bacterium]
MAWFVRRGGAPGLALWLALAVLVIVADQVTKTLVLQQFHHGEVRPLAPFFNLVRVHNTGAAFNFLADAAGWQRWFFVVLGVVVSGFIIWMIRAHPQQRLFCFAVTMIMGGALGNVVDRLLHGYVVDFLQFRFGFLEPVFHGGFFPSFNLADSAITLGAACLILDELLRVRRSP